MSGAWESIVPFDGSTDFVSGSGSSSVSAGAASGSSVQASITIHDLGYCLVTPSNEFITDNNGNYLSAEGLTLG